MNIELPASSGYQVFASIGVKTDAASGSLWTTKGYGSTDSFIVSAGVITKKTLVAEEIPFALIDPSSTPASVSVVDSKLWKLVGKSLVGGTAPLDISGQGFSVNSLSAGKWFSGSDFASELWLNTDTGIYALGSTSFIQRSSALGVKASAAVVANFDGNLAGTNSLAVFYYGADVGFAYSDLVTATSIDGWSTKGSLSGYLNSSDGASFKNLIPDPGAFIKSTAFVINGDSTYGFIATALGSYYYNKALQDNVGTEIMIWLNSQLNGTASVSYSITAGSGVGSPAIHSFAFDDAASPTSIYAGTDKGIYWSKVNVLDGTPATAQLAQVVGDVKVSKLAAAKFGAYSYIGYIDGEGSLIVRKLILTDGSSTVVGSYPFYSYTATRSGARSIAFYIDTGVLKLAVASLDGVATLNVPME